MNIEEELIKDEGKIPHVYKDHLGYYTIGVGTLIDERLGGGLRDSEIMFILRNRIREARQELDRVIPWWRGIGGDRGAVLLLMAFQLGVPRLMLFKRALYAIEREDFETGADEMLDSKWATQTPERAQRMASIMRSGVAPANG
jgi:lysozyme